MYNAQQSDVMSDLALANVEALASGESSTTNRYQSKRTTKVAFKIFFFILFLVKKIIIFIFSSYSRKELHRRKNKNTACLF